MRPDDNAHDEAEALLPWYATGQLDVGDRALVDAHLVSCARCVAVAAAQFAFLILAGGILLSLSRPDYRALGSASAAPAANLIVIFRPDATEQDMRSVLRASGASLVGGPTSADAYLLHVAAADRPTAIARLQSDRHVQMAQPIDGSARS